MLVQPTGLRYQGAHGGAWSIAQRAADGGTLQSSVAIAHGAADDRAAVVASDRGPLCEPHSSADLDAHSGALAHPVADPIS